MKRILPILLATALLLAACGDTTGASPQESRELVEATEVELQGEQSSEQEQPSEPEPEPEPLKQPTVTAEDAAELLAEENGIVPISRADQLMALSALVNSGDETHRDKTYVLQRDVSLAGYDFIPIGGVNEGDPDDPDAPLAVTAKFEGTFDGGGFLVKGVTVRDNAHLEGSGLFGYVGPGGSVSNLHLTGGNIAGVTSVGGVAGVMEGKLFNCSFNGQVAAAGEFVGGLVGILRGSEHTPGLATAESCFINAEVSGWGAVGGLAGTVAESAAVSDCYVLGRVSARLPEDAAIEESSAVGGFTGTNDGSIARCFSHNEVYSYNKDALTGGFIGDNDGKVLDCYYNAVATENWKPVGRHLEGQEQPGLTGCTVEELLEQETYQNWDFETVWELDGEHNRGLPFLRAAELY